MLFLVLATTHLALTILQLLESFRLQVTYHELLRVSKQSVSYAFRFSNCRVRYSVSPVFQYTTFIRSSTNFRDIRLAVLRRGCPRHQCYCNWPKRMLDELRWN